MKILGKVMRMLESRTSRQEKVMRLLDRAENLLVKAVSPKELQMRILENLKRALGKAMKPLDKIGNPIGRVLSLLVKVTSNLASKKTRSVKKTPMKLLV